MASQQKLTALLSTRSKFRLISFNYVRYARANNGGTLLDGWGSTTYNGR